MIFRKFDMKCTIFSVLLLVDVFNWGWVVGFKYNANIYNLKKTHPQKMHRHLITMKTVQNWELPTMHILYINLWTFVHLCSLSGVFSDTVSNAFLNLLEILFNEGLRNYIWKNWLYAHFSCRSVGPQWPVAP